MTQAAHSTIDQDEVDQFSRIAEEWWDEHGKFKPLHKINPVRISYLRDRISEHFNRSTAESCPFDGISLLDIGCGGGLVSEPMARLGCTVTGIDASEKNIGVASLHAQQVSLEIDYRCTTAEELIASASLAEATTAEASQFDVVLALEIIEHVADVELFLQSVANLAKPGGLIILSTMNRNLKSLLMAKIGAEYILRWLPRGTHDWRKFLLPSEVEAGLEPYNVSVTQIDGMVYNPLRDQWSISPTDIDVNYLMVCERS